MKYDNKTYERLEDIWINLILFNKKLYKLDETLNAELKQAANIIVSVMDKIESEVLNENY